MSNNMDAMKRWLVVCGFTMVASATLLMVLHLRGSSSSHGKKSVVSFSASSWIRRGLMNPTSENRQYTDRNLQLPVHIEDFGSDGGGRVGTLGLCQGDCDHDSDCADGLVCFQRDAGDPIPGCDGTPNSRSDFCVTEDDLSTSIKSRASSTLISLLTTTTTTSSIAGASTGSSAAVGGSSTTDMANTNPVDTNPIDPSSSVVDQQEGIDNNDSTTFASTRNNNGFDTRIESDDFWLKIYWELGTHKDVTASELLSFRILTKAATTSLLSSFWPFPSLVSTDTACNYLHI